MKWKLSASLIGLTLIFCLSFCKQNPSSSTKLNPYLNTDTAVHYVGIDACKSCHYDKYITFLETGMGGSFNHATLKKTAANFKQVVPVYDAYKDLYFLPFIAGNTIFIKAYRMDKNDTIFSRIEKISYIIGSGHHTNSHFTEENGFVFQAPLTYYTQKGQWDLPPGFENGNNSVFERKIGLECMSCHNAIPNLINGSENQYRQLPHGIDCERCHGPGELHVKEKTAGKIVDVSKQVDYTIVNPAKLSWQQQIDVCQRCHLQGNAVLKPGKAFTDFRPGTDLSTVFDQFSPQYEGGDDFVMAAHAERFQMSKCFKASVQVSNQTSKPGFTCISCHNPHVSVRKTNTEKFNNTCNSCHSNNTQKHCTADQKSIQNQNNNCVKCHMPSSGTSDIPHVTVHDHYIRKPDLSPKGKGKLVGLRCITNSNPDKATETEAYISYYEKFESNPLYLKKADEISKQLDKTKSDHAIILIHLFYINENYKGIIDLISSVEPVTDAWTAYRIAKAFEKSNQNSESVLWYKKAIELKPLYLDIQLQYAYLLIKIKDFKSAAPVLEKLNSLYSKNPEVWACLGLVAMNSNDPSKARKCFNTALNLDPDQLTALQNLKIIEEILGNTAASISIQERINKIYARAK